MGFYDLIANWSFALVDLISIELIFTLIFTIKEGGGIKFTLDFGMSKFRTTSLYVVVFLVVGILYFNFSNLVQDKIISYFSSLGFSIIPLFVTLLGFGGFWASKVFLGRNWNNKAVLYSMLTFGFGLSVFIITLL